MFLPLSPTPGFLSDLSGVTSEMVSLYINLSSVPWACLRQDAGRCVFGSSSLSKGNKELPVCGDPRRRQNFHGRPSSLRPHEACELWTGQGRLGPDGHAALSESDASLVACVLSVAMQSRHMCGEGPIFKGHAIT